MAMLSAALRRVPPPVLAQVGKAVLRTKFTRRMFDRASRSLRSHESTISHGPAAGMRINPAGSNLGYALGTTEPRVQEFLEKHLHPGDVFYDIGANVGFFSLLGARLVKHGRVYAFEPLPDNARALRRNLSLNGLDRVKIIEAAVAAEPGVAELLLGASSLEGHLRNSYDQDAGAPAIAVSVVAIDRLVADGRIHAPNLVKIDAEGAEAKVLRGMAETLCRHRPIVLCEIHEQGRPEALLEVLSTALGEAAATYRVEFIADDEAETEEVWAPHAVAMPLR